MKKRFYKIFDNLETEISDSEKAELFELWENLDELEASKKSSRESTSSFYSGIYRIAASIILILGLGSILFLTVLNNSDEEVPFLLNEELPISRIRSIQQVMNNAATIPSNKVFFDVLDNDSNVNVRLTALEAILDHNQKDPELRSKLIQSIPKQTSPNIQLALYREVTRNNDLTGLELLIDNPQVHPVVHERLNQINR